MKNGSSMAAPSFHPSAFILPPYSLDLPLRRVRILDLSVSAEADAARAGLADAVVLDLLPEVLQDGLERHRHDLPQAADAGHHESVGQPLDFVLHTGWATANKHRASNEIVIVNIDDASLREIGNWPWPRSQHARLVDQLSRMGSRLILFDIIFAYPSDKAGDAAFDDALKRSGRVTLPILARKESEDRVFPLEQFSRNAGLADIDLARRPRLPRISNEHQLEAWHGPLRIKSRHQPHKSGAEIFR